MRTAVIIPARFRSTRFPGKPLVDILGASLIRRVWDGCAAAVGREQVYVATEDVRIAEHCREYDIQVVMTTDTCLTGTDRVWEASLQVEADLYVNVQGDEPLVSPTDIRSVIAAAHARPGVVVNAMCPITEERDYLSRTVPKVVAANDGRLLYMSRAPIPSNKDGAFTRALRQVCIYAFPPAMLAAFAAVTRKTPLECEEDIEILRLLELGHDVYMVEVSSGSLAVDVPDDVARVEAALLDQGVACPPP